MTDERLQEIERLIKVTLYGNKQFIGLELVNEIKRLKAENKKTKEAELEIGLNELFDKITENLKKIKDGLDSLRSY